MTVQYTQQLERRGNVVMKRVLIAGGISVLSIMAQSGNNALGGGLLHGALHHSDDCGCHSAPAAVYAAPVVQSGHAMAGCCGVGGGIAQIGGLYSAELLYDGHAGGGGSPGSFLSGYEGLPNMDGGGVHYRYPYHSYRRPWAHPGPPSTNISIVW